MARHQTTPVRTVGRFGLCALALAVVVSADSRASRRVTQSIDAEDSTPYRVALAELGKLDARQGTPESRSEILVRNLSRYFTVYLVPSDQEELRRLLGTAQRMTQQVARILYRGGQAAATQAGSASVEAEHIDLVLDSLLPSEPSPFGEQIFFPGVAPTVLEDWDLRALADTGLAWEALGGLADAEVATAESPLPMTGDAARRLAEGVNAYGLLIFRLGGEHAKTGLDTHVRTSHLRAAGKTIRDRAEGKPSPIGEVPERPETGSLFTDVTAAFGLDDRHVTSEWLSRFRRYGPIAPTFSGGGVAAGDLDGDGWDDLVLCGGNGCRSWINREGRRFENTTAASGLRIDGEARSPLLADFDNDGDLDLFVTYARDSNRLFENVGGGRFRDVTQQSGLFLEGDISGPATTADFDGDGRLDLYVGNFGNYLAGDSAWVAQDAKNAMANRLYLQSEDGPLRFVESAVGVGDEGWAQALSHVDYDLDGDQDIYIANDFGRNQLLRNDGQGRFEAVGESTGSDDPYHGMNVAFADLNRDRRPDIFITNIWFWASAKREVTETNTLLLSAPDGGYERSTAPALVEHDSSWAWAALFFDVENDGDDDLFVANGFTDYMTFVQYREHPEIPDQLYATNNGDTANLFFRGDGSGLPSELVADSGTELPGTNSRSAALLDVDRDGDLDLVVTTFHDSARLFRNDAAEPHRALTLQLVGDPGKGSPRDAIGATVIARSGDFYAWRTVQGGEGYLGMSTLPVEIGTGELDAVDLEVLWPSGERQTFEGVATGRALRLEQGSSELAVRWSFAAPDP